ncbi:MAG: DUF2884 family protein [Dokdonella sp.]
MIRFAAAFVLSALCTSAVHAGIDLGQADCRVHSDYSLTIKPDSLVFARAEGHRADVVISQGTLQVNGRQVAVGVADRQRLLDIEHSVRTSVPEVQAIAHAAIAVAFEAVGEVSAAFARDADAARASAQRMSQAAHDLHARIDSSDSFAGWQHADIDRLVGGAVQSMVGEIAASVAARAVTVALSGDEKAAADLEARANGIEKNVGRIIARHTKDLEERALGLCSRVRSLAGIEGQLDLRLSDGSRLDLVRIED